MLDARFVFLGAGLHAAGSIRYLLRTIQGTTIPNRVTWALWAVAPLIAFAAEISEGVGLRSLLTLMVGLSPVSIFIASFARRAGRWRPSRFDLVCGALSVLGLVLWQLSGEGDIAIILSLFADALAAAPTVLKSLRTPETESYSVYLGATGSAIITLLTIRHWTLAAAAWPIYIAGLGLVLVYLIRFPRRSRAPRGRHLTGV